MGGKKGGGGQEVNDYLMSIDYAFCYGPLDSVNQVYVKDKPIWCGYATERQDIEVNQPKLFGGDEGEGGVVGTVEVYMGTDDQVASPDLADRAGLTPAEMPGYRGVAHMFFRGGVGGAYFDAEGGIYEGVEAELTGEAMSQSGFMWSTNNPYLPSMKAHITRLPSTLGDEHKAIFTPLEDENGQLIHNPLVAGGYDPEKPSVLLPPPPAFPFAWFGTGIFPDDHLRPWERINWNHIPEAVLAVGAELGWIPRFRMTHDRRWLDGAGDVVPTMMYVRLQEHDSTGAVIKTHNWSGVDLVIDEVHDLLPETREVRYTNVSDISSGDFVSGPGGTGVKVWFEDEPLTAPDLAFNVVEGNITTHQAAGQVYDLVALGFDPRAIDEGLVTVAAVGSATARMTGIGGSGPASFTASMHYAALRADENDQPDWVTDGADGMSLTRVSGGGSDVNTPVSSTDGSGQANEYTETLLVPPGARFISGYFLTNLLMFTFTEWVSRSAKFVVTGPATVSPTIHCSVDGTLRQLPNANPAHMIYECLTNKEWGKGEATFMVNATSFRAEAETLYNEFFGLSMVWVKQDTMEKFIQEILDHISAALYQDPATGLWTLKLLRNDYDAAAAPLLDPSNARLSNRKRRAWGETINEIVVSYTDPLTETEATVTAHNLGNIAMNGGVISETRNYYGVRDPKLAQVIANRDVESAGYPVFTTQATVSRKFWNLRPGGVVRLNWPVDGIEEMVCRIVGINYGSPSDRDIVLDLSEDIFSVEQTTYSSAQGSLLPDDTAVPASPLDDLVIVTAPMPLLIRNGVDAVEFEESYPVVAVAFLASSTPRPIDVEAHANVTLANGSTEVQSILTFPPVRVAALTAALAPEAASSIPRADVARVRQGAEAVGDILMLGSDEVGSELVMLDAFVPATNTWSVIRGVWDTVPRAWPVGSRLWDMPTGTRRVDPRERAAGDSLTYKFLPRNGANRLAYADAPAHPVTFSDRPHAPFRPAHCQLDGTGFAGVDYTYPAALPTSVTATWTTRNRLTEDVVTNRWDNSNVVPETGQTTVLRFYDRTGTYSHEITGLSGDTREITFAEFSGLDLGYVEFLSERDGIRSFDGLRLQFDMRQGGYGLDYGLIYR